MAAPDPRLPLCAAPGPFRRLEEPWGDEEEHPPSLCPSTPGSECPDVDLGCCSEEEADGCCAPGAAGCGCFGRLLLALAAEHRRALAEQRRVLEKRASLAASLQSSCDGCDVHPMSLKELSLQAVAASATSVASERSPVVSNVRSSTAVGGPVSPSATQNYNSTSGLQLSADEVRRCATPVGGWEDMVCKTQKSGRLSPFDFASETESKGDWLSSPGDFGERHSRTKSLLRKLVGPHFQWRKVLSQSFDAASTIAIVLNSALIGWEANTAVTGALEGRSPQATGVVKELSRLFTAWFVLELVVRLSCNGWRGYYRNSGWSWHLLDILVVGSDVVQTLLEALADEEQEGDGSVAMQNLTVVRMLRILRITRALRILRIVRFFRELRMMVLSVLRSYSSLLWSLVLLGVTIYAFAVYFVQVVAYHVHEVESAAHRPQLREWAAPLGESEMEELKASFGNLLRAEYTLYLSVSGGVSWGEVAHLLIAVDPLHGVVYCFFTFFTTFALLNIITGIFVETSISSARSSQEELAQEQLHMTRGLRDEMKKIFARADRGKRGSVNLAEFEEWLQSKEVRAYLDALGIETDKAKALFELLDLDMSGEITAEEFTFGCLRLKGAARSIDLATLMNHTTRMSEQFRGFFRFTENQFRQLQDFESRIEEHFRMLFGPFDGGEIIRSPDPWGVSSSETACKLSSLEATCCP